MARFTVTGGSLGSNDPSRSAALQEPDPQPFRDVLIAATALVHNLVVVTRNLADFKATGVRLLNPWQQPRAAGAAGFR